MQKGEGEGRCVDYQAELTSLCADEMLKTKVNVFAAGRSLLRGELLSNVALLDQLYLLTKQCEKGVDRSAREAKLRLAEMDKARGKTELTKRNKKVRSDKFSEVTFTKGKKGLEKLSKKELIDQATLRGAKCHQGDAKPDLLDFCLKYTKLQWTPYDSASESSFSDKSEDDDMESSSAESDPEPAKKMRKRK